jgi:hypothetical protein
MPPSSSSLKWLAVWCLWLIVASPCVAHTGNHNNYYDHQRIRKSLAITWEPAAPNGVLRNIIKVNGQFPGPALIFNEDDDVEVGDALLIFSQSSI